MASSHLGPHSLLTEQSESNQPITERSNELTENIDISNPLGIVRQLRQVDAQLFAGWRHWEGILDDNVLNTVDRLSNTVVQFLKDTANNAVVLSGCGTSGRLAFVTAKTFNDELFRQRLITRPFYHYIISGGDQSLLKSHEAFEDSWAEGICSLEQVIGTKKKVLYIGITCGLSATFVAAQLHYCLKHSDKCTPVLLGFNLPSMARTTRPPGSELSFKDVVDQLLMQAAEGRAYVLTPVVGPEAIAGSTRMKSGSATKMLLEAILMRAHQQHCHLREIGVTESLLSYEVTCGHTYLQCQDIAAVLKLAGNSLSAGGHVYYLGVNTVGILALIDASECPPTYGASYDDVRAFILGAKLGLQGDGELSDQALGWDHFRAHFLHTLTPLDLVIFVLSRQDVDTKVAAEVTSLCSAIHAHKAAVLVGVGELPKVDGSMFDHCVRVVLPREVIASYWSCELEQEEVGGGVEALSSQMAVKWVLNAVSTGAHIIKGKVLRNRMVDLHLSNEKLFCRAVKLVEDFSSLSKQEALKCVLSSIYRTDNVTASLLTDSVEKHIQSASHRTSVMPLALLKSTGKFTIGEALKALEQDPVIRSVLTKHAVSITT